MKGVVKKIHPLKRSRNGNTYIRIEFQMEDGKWAETDVCPDFRNYSRWKPILEEGVGTHVRGLKMRDAHQVDADSYTLITSQPVSIKEQQKQPEVDQLKML